MGGARTAAMGINERSCDEGPGYVPPNEVEHLKENPVFNSLRKHFSMKSPKNQNHLHNINLPGLNTTMKKEI